MFWWRRAAKRFAEGVDFRTSRLYNKKVLKYRYGKETSKDEADNGAKNRSC